jgi:hypothetical protein
MSDIKLPSKIWVIVNHASFYLYGAFSDRQEAEFKLQFLPDDYGLYEYDLNHRLKKITNVTYEELK